MREEVDQVTGVARLLVGDHGAWRRLLDEHVADSSGHCLGCRSPSRPPPVWPCRLHGIGAEARRFAAMLPDTALSTPEPGSARSRAPSAVPHHAVTAAPSSGFDHAVGFGHFADGIVGHVTGRSTPADSQ